MYNLISFILISIVLILAPSVIIFSIIKVIKPKWGGDPFFFKNLFLKILLGSYFYKKFSHKVIVTINDKTNDFNASHFSHIPKKFSLFFEIVFLLFCIYKYIIDLLKDLVLYLYKVLENKNFEKLGKKLFLYFVVTFTLIFHITIYALYNGNQSTESTNICYRFVDYFELIFNYLKNIVLLGSILFSKFLIVLINGMEFPVNVDINVKTTNVLESSNNSQDNSLLIEESRPNSSQSNNPGSISNSPQDNSQLSIRGSNSPQDNSRELQTLSRENQDRMSRRFWTQNRNNQSVIIDNRSRSPVNRIPNYRSRSPIIYQSIESNNDIQRSSNEVAISEQTTTNSSNEVAISEQTTSNSSELINTQNSIERRSVFIKQIIRDFMLSKGYVLRGYEFNSNGVLSILSNILSHIDHNEIFVLPDSNYINMNGREMVHDYINEILNREISNPNNSIVYDRGMSLDPEYYSFENPDNEPESIDINPLWMYTDGDDMFLGFTPNYWSLKISNPEYNNLNIFQKTYKLIAQPIIYKIELYENRTSSTFDTNFNFSSEEEKFSFHGQTIIGLESRLSLLKYYLYLYPDVDRRGALISELEREIENLKVWLEDEFGDTDSDT